MDNNEINARIDIAYRVARAINSGHEPYAPYVSELRRKLETETGPAEVRVLLEGMIEEWTEFAQTPAADAEKARRARAQLELALAEVRGLAP